MKRIFNIVFLGVLILTSQGCELDDDQNFHFVSLRIIEAELPESFELNRIHTIQVTYERPNGCIFFEGFDVFPEGNTTRNVVAIGSEINDGDTACTQAIEEVEASFQFEVLFTETYTFRFYNGDDAGGNPIYLEYEVQVADGEPTN